MLCVDSSRLYMSGLSLCDLCLRYSIFGSQFSNKYLLTYVSPMAQRQRPSAKGRVWCSAIGEGKLIAGLYTIRCSYCSTFDAWGVLLGTVAGMGACQTAVNHDSLWAALTVWASQAECCCKTRQLNSKTKIGRERRPQKHFSVFILS